MHPHNLLALIAQTYLAEMGFYKGKLDGNFGPVSRAAAVAWWKQFDAGAAWSDHIMIIAAQRLLTNAGFYSAKIDGKWGPLSKAAAHEWLDDQPGQAPAPAPPTSGQTPYGLARTHLGTREIPGKKDNPIIIRWLRSFAAWVTSEETPWCSAFANAMAKETGYERTGKLNARSWLDVGLEIKLKDAKRGDVVILTRGNPKGWEGHVAFLDFHDKKTGQLYLLGGNQSNAVNVSTYPVTRLLGIRRLRPLDRLEGGRIS
jgi:uncharacterized protein (TIGR02594 family)